MRVVTWAALAALCVSAAPAPALAQDRALPTTIGRETGDFDQMQKHRLVRVLVPWSRTFYYHDGAAQRGTMAAAAHELEKHLNQRFKGSRPFVVAILPTTRDKLIPGLLAGEGDIAAGDVTVTEARAKLVDFTLPTLSNVAEIIVTGPTAPPLATLDDLAGQEVHVRRSTSYFESLNELNERFAREGKPKMVLRLLPDAIEDEDKLDMLDAGLIRIAVIDDWLGRIWAPRLPDVKLRPDLVLRSGGEIAWAVRKTNPKLRAVLDETIRTAKKKSVPEVIIGHAGREAVRLHNSTSSAERKKFDAAIGLFRKYGSQYGFDSLMLAAQGYQESRLDQHARSRVGAIGVMQVMPATGKELGVGDIRQLEPNVHAGARYLSQLIERYFADARFDETNRTLFAFASYNCGPRNIAKARQAAAAQGLDADVWFNNVELVVARKVGQEPVRYVRNVYKYYVAYRLALDAEAERARAVGAVGTK
jgi:membrane-bound lytic murein transglycosylase MltF